MNHITQNPLASKPLIVIKVGGSLLKDTASAFPRVADAIAKFKAQNPEATIALVHGGGPHILTALNAKDMHSEIIDGYRVTPETHLPIVEKVLFSELYQQLYAQLTHKGIPTTLWSSPMDLPVSGQQKKTPNGVPLWGLVGDHLCWDLNTLEACLNRGELLLLPSLATPGLNINADDLAASLAANLKADALVFLTDVEGVIDKGGQVLAYLTPEISQALQSQGVVSGGMQVKVNQGFSALAQGVSQVVLCPLEGLPTLSGTVLLPEAGPKANRLMSTYLRKPLTFVEGYGPWLVADDGKTYLDMVSGVAVNTLGHAHPRLVEALERQAGKLWHLSNLYYSPEQLRLADRLTARAQMASVFFSNSGTEAVEAALKIARKYGKRFGAYKRKLLHLSGSFHGRTFGALTVTSNVHYQAPFLPLIGDTEEIPSGDITALKRAMSDDVCAIILEPIQGESGVQPVDPAFIAVARALCDQYNALLIFDEVQCGIGRTGTLFYFEQLGIAPDVLCLAKGLGGGFPIGATLVNNRADVLVPGDHGSTFGGNPLATACANAVLDALEAKGEGTSENTGDNLLSEVGRLGRILKAKLKQRPHPLVASVTGEGLFLGLHLNSVASASASASVSASASDLVAAAQAQGLLLIAAGPQTVRLLPPLNITEDVLFLAIERLYKALDTLITPPSTQVV